MKLDNNYEVKKDANNFILSFTEEKGMNKDTGKQIVSKRETYHNTLYDALVAYSRKVIDLPESVSEMKRRIQYTEGQIKSALKFNQ